MEQKIHWRKTAKACPQCHKLKSKNCFIHDLAECAECSFDNAIWKNYQKCLYCKRWL